MDTNFYWISRKIVSMINKAHKDHPDWSKTDLAYMISGFLDSALIITTKKGELKKR